mmetsp:Transcript_65766/g.118520  ORF Transcript_65766/g.118520 Transcript_65766/m.118520 type:complete len:107 (+) Transcript_65766:1050-1370(+)
MAPTAAAEVTASSSARTSATCTRRCNRGSPKGCSCFSGSFVENGQWERCQHRAGRRNNSLRLGAAQSPLSSGALVEEQLLDPSSSKVYSVSMVYSVLPVPSSEAGK